MTDKPPQSPLDPPPQAVPAAPAPHAHGHSAELTLTIDGQSITVPHGTTICDAARLNGIAIPTLCHQQNQTPVAVCRVCVVDCGERAYQAACIRECEPDMKVQTASPGVLAARKTLYELLLSDHPSPCIRQQHRGDADGEPDGASVVGGGSSVVDMATPWSGRLCGPWVPAGPVVGLVRGMVPVAATPPSGRFR